MDRIVRAAIGNALAPSARITYGEQTCHERLLALQGEYVRAPVVNIQAHGRLDRLGHGS
jgi:hypothetical protein